MDQNNQIPDASAPVAPAPVTNNIQQPAPQQPVVPAEVPTVVAPTPEVVEPQPTTGYAQQYTQSAPFMELPQDVSDRTKEQFDKLLDSNKKLLESNQKLQEEFNQRLQSEQTLQPLRDLGKPQQPDIAEFVELETDPYTGQTYKTINDKKLQEALGKANDRAVRAEQQIQEYIRRQQQAEDARQAAETYKTYPELKPGGEKFDANLNKVTRRIALDSMMNPQDYGGRSLTFKEAADLAAEELRGAPAPVQQGGQSMQQQNVNQQPQQPGTTSVKEQAGLSIEGQPGIGQPNLNAEEDLNALREYTRRGGERGTWALAQRLQSVAHTGTPTSKADIGEE